MLESVREHKRNQLVEAKAVTAALEAEWSRMTPDFDPSFQTIAGNLYAVTALAQERAARDAIDYVPEVLDERGTSTMPVARVEPKAFTGVTGGGYSLMTEFKTSVIRMKQAVATGASVFVALKVGRSHMLRVAQTAIADAGRGAERVSMATNKCGGYVRVVTLPSCPKCLILAGRVYGSEEAFKRHPRCDCRHAPFSERGDVRDDEVLNPSEVFDRLPNRQQDEIFGQADAEAIRNGADIYQVVNARRGMYTTADGFTYTREGTTRRGLYQLRQQTLGTPGRRRYTPEQIQKVATSKDHYLQLLKTYGYIF